MSPPDTPPDFDPLAQQAAAFADTLDRSGTVHVETPPAPAKPAPAIATGTSRDDAPADSWQGADPLADHVDARDNAAIVRDPEAGVDPPSIRVGNSPPQPVEATIEREPHDPQAGHVERVEQRSHLEAPEPSTDRYAGDSFNPLEQSR